MTTIKRILAALPLLVALAVAAPALHATSGGFTINNLDFTASAVSGVTTGTCSSETCTSPTGDCSNVRGEITATCTAGQTIIVAFSGTLAVAPVCVVSAANAAADPVTSGEMVARATTSALTITRVTAMTTGAVSYTCFP